MSGYNITYTVYEGQVALNVAFCIAWKSREYNGTSHIYVYAICIIYQMLY